MNNLKILLLLAFLSLPIAGFDLWTPTECNCNQRVLSLFCVKCWGPCVLREDYGNKLRETLSEKFFGQEHAIPAIIEMFESRDNTHPRLISFHIAGDNGVGKSYLAQLFADSLYQYSSRSGMLIISGTNYQGQDVDTVVKHRESLFNVISNQIDLCPNSLIIIDDVQYIHSSTLLVLQQFMENTDHIVTKEGRKIFKNRAFIGLISDFGIEGRTANRTFEQLEEIMVNHTRELWDIDPKQTQLIQYTFPFVSLSNQDLENIARHIVTKRILESDKFAGIVNKVDISDAAVKWVRHSAQKKFPLENGRGVEKWVQRFLVPEIGREVKKRGKSKNILEVDVTYDNQELSVEVKEIKKEEL